MKKQFRLTALARGVLCASTSVIAAGTLLSSSVAIAAPLPPGMTEASGSLHRIWLVDKPNGAGMLRKNDASQNVYFSHHPRKDGDIQTLFVQGTDLHGHYINASDKGTANIIMGNHARTDFIEAGNPGQKTSTHIILDNSTLEGAISNHNYDDKPAHSRVMNKNYLAGAAIYLDPKDSGDLSVGILNHSTVNGDISAGQSGTKRVEISDSALHNGGIVFDGPSENSITVKKGVIDARGRTGRDRDAAISLSGARSNTLIVAQNSTLNGGIHLTGTGHNDRLSVSNSMVSAPGHYALNDSGAKNLNLNVTGSQLVGDISIAQADVTDITVKDSALNGNIAIDSRSHAVLNLQHSQIAGKLNPSGAASQEIMVDNSSLSGMDARRVSGNMNVTLQNNATIDGDILLGSGNNTLTLNQGIALYGKVDGGSSSPKNTLLMKGDTTVVGSLTRFHNITTSHDDLLLLDEVSNANINLNNRSYLGVAHKLTDSTIFADTSSQVNVADMAGKNTVTVGELSAGTHPGTHKIVEFHPSSPASMRVAFANQQRTATARQGAYNYDLRLVDQHTKDASQVRVEVKQTGLANDVKGAIAGLEGTKQSSASVTGSIASHMNARRVDALFNGTQPGVRIWADYLSHSGTNKAAVSYKNALRGAVLGMDNTWLLDGGDDVTLGVAFSQVRDKLSGTSPSDTFNNAVTGNYYSVYGGWQQALNSHRWSLFTEGNASYGDNSYALSSSNVGTSTTTIRERLQSAYKGKIYSAEMRTGLSMKPTDTLLLQPYAVVGWNKTTTGDFSNNYVRFNAAQDTNWYAGGGARITASADVGHTRLEPWIDVSYISEFSNKDSLTANAQRVSNTRPRRTASVGAGLNADVTRDLSLNVGAFTGTGDTRHNLDVIAGVKYAF